MIKNLHIENYALIEWLDIDLHQGFSVITGETGAGKSIILGAIGLLTGGRADMKAIKTCAKRCTVEATFDLTDYNMGDFFEENDLDFDGSECVMRRELTASGKSRAFINDTPVALSLMKELGEQLIDIHSQHKNLLLAKADFQLNTLDIVAGNRPLLDEYTTLFKSYKELSRQLEKAIDEAQTNKEEEDYLKFQTEQLANAALKEGEEEELEAESELLENAETIKRELYTAANRLQSEHEQSDVLSMLKEATSHISNITNVLSTAQELAERIDSCYIELKDVANELENQAEEIEYNPKRLEQVNERLDTIYALEKKHGVDTVKELLALQAELEEKLMRITNSDDFIGELRKKVDAQKEKALDVARKLSKTRHEAAKKVEKLMVEKLLPLGMPNVQFACAVTSDDEPTSTGIDHVQYLFNANKNGTPQPVSQIASGGEIARVMLSLKALIAGAVKLPTIIFDEIDTGVSGSIAEQMARIMREMGQQNRQVISITHLPQIAAMGSHHYRVFKEDTDDSTLSHIAELDNEQRVKELAHMLSGATITQAALDNARALLAQ